MGTLYAASRVREIWTGTTTSTITLSGTAASGPPGGYRTFATAGTNGYDYRVLIEHRTAAEWMIARYTYSSGAGTLTYVSLESSSTGSQVTFSAGTKHIAVVHGSTDSIAPEFAGSVTVGGNLSVGGIGSGPYQIGILEPSAGGTSATGFKAPALAADVIYTLPTADGSAGQTLITDGSKVLSWAGRRELLSANRTYYVRTDGSDSNTGLANTAGGAFLTIQKAIDVVSGTLDIATYTVTIQVANGTYTGAVVCKSCIGTGSVTLSGDTTTPANVVISTTSADAITASACSTVYTIDGFKIQTTTSGSGVFSEKNSAVTVARVNFGACATYHAYASLAGSITFSNNYTVSGAAVCHWIASRQAAIICTGFTVTISGTPAFAGGWAYAENHALIVAHTNTYSGSATGPRYTATLMSLIQTNGAGTTALPGNSAGTPSAADTASATLGLYH